MSGIEELDQGGGLSRFREFHGALKVIQKAFLLAIPIAGVLFILDIQTRLRVTFWKEQYIGIFLALVLSSIFLNTPPSKRSSSRVIPWYDYMLVLASLVVGAYIAILYPSIFTKSRAVGYFTPEVIILGGIMILLTLEALRRLFGWILVGLVAFFILYAAYSNYFPGPFQGKGLSWLWLLGFLYLDPTSFMYLVGIAATMIVTFILFGEIMFGFAGGKVLTDLALRLMGRFSGGPAKVAVVSAGLFGMVSGSPVANILVTGSVTIPMMKDHGYKPHEAAGIVSVASSGGMIMPPVMGIVAFIMADMIGVPYPQVAIAAFVPACLYYLALFIYSHLIAVKSGLKGLSVNDLPRIRPIVGKLWLVILPFGVLIYTLFVISLNPATAAAYSAIATVIIMVFAKENRVNFWKRLVFILQETGKLVTTVGVLLVAAGFVTAIIGTTGLGFRLSLSLVEIGGGNSFILLIVAAALSMIIGMGTDPTAAYILVATLVAPALVEIGVPILPAHLFCLYYGNLALITPPIAVSAFVSAGIARCSPMKTGYAAMRIAVLTYIVPFLFVYNPALLMKGPVWIVIIEVAIALVATFALGIAITGYFFRGLRWPVRFVMAAASISLLVSIAVPMMPWGLALKLIGLVIFIPLILREWLKHRVALPVAILN